MRYAETKCKETYSEILHYLEVVKLKASDTESVMCLARSYENVDVLEAVVKAAEFLEAKIACALQNLY